MQLVITKDTIEISHFSKTIVQSGTKCLPYALLYQVAFKMLLELTYLGSIAPYGRSFGAEPRGTSLHKLNATVPGLLVVYVGW